jgi:hypothetical protein
LLIDWQAAKEEWAAEVRTRLIPRLQNDRRFPASGAFIARFERSVERWRAGGEIRQLINDANEFAAAAELLKVLKADDRLSYEPRLSGTSKTIDFLVRGKDGSRGWIDVKTVAPAWNNDEVAWNRFVGIAKGFPSNARLVVSRDFCGAAIGGQALNTRWSFVRRTIEVEAKAALLTAQERGPVRLLFCSAGEWREDDLEDFANFYRTGNFREDDWAQNAVARYMTEKGLSFTRVLSGFCYLKRHHEDAEACSFRKDVEGPAMFAPAAYPECQSRKLNHIDQRDRFKPAFRVSSRCPALVTDFSRTYLLSGVARHRPNPIRRRDPVTIDCHSSFIRQGTAIMPINAQGLIEKIQTLPPERLMEVEDFVDFLRLREQERALTRAAAAASAPTFAAVWNNPEDDVYDAL